MCYNTFIDDPDAPAVAAGISKGRATGTGRKAPPGNRDRKFAEFATIRCCGVGAQQRSELMETIITILAVVGVLVGVGLFAWHFPVTYCLMTLWSLVSGE